ncbi:GGDEF domain-containing protein [Brevibacillus ruminantium]|uniref:GGDEF domain-containing protein n=1 Tax=Brevibacillus ruminantium TaxID=2950604 RepID=A0ABY4WKP3_9BACL|nr:GGDEF domain-containing protein [Brevibacillus ruminantium]USG67692.1 GGDEF domain-containing protein [Brevibacillus ruminantium]
MKISEIMTTSVHTISSWKSVSSAAEQMNERKIGSLLVVDHNEVMGILTSRDVRSAHPNRIVADAMTPSLITVTPDQDIWHAYHLLKAHQIERILVMEDSQMKGLVTREEIMRKLSESLDAHTGLYRAPYIRYIGEELLKQRKPFHLIFVDINDFGRINKEHGHPFGDDVIRALSTRLVNLVHEKDDFLCRYAGDEFVIISLADEERIDEYLKQITKPMVLDDVPISVAVGYLNGRKEPEFFSHSLKELLRKVSLMSSLNKQYKKERSWGDLYDLRRQEEIDISSKESEDEQQGEGVRKGIPNIYL